VRLHPGIAFGLLKELRTAVQDDRPLVVGGAPALAEALRKQLAAGGGPGWVRSGPVEDAAMLVYVLAAPPSENDERLLGQAAKARVPVVAVLAGPELDPRVPHVLATDVVRVPAGSGFPVDEIARVVAHKLGEAATSLAAALPVLRPAVCEELIQRFSRKAGVLGAAVFLPGADLPALTILQARMVLRIAAAHGVEVGQERLPELMGVLASGLAFRAIARQAVGVVPLAGWAVKGAIAYAGTRALGEAAARYFAARAPTDAAAAARPSS
jgi:uncharacterized protein (DUF697 family)